MPEPPPAPAPEAPPPVVPKEETPAPPPAPVAAAWPAFVSATPGQIGTYFAQRTYEPKPAYLQWLTETAQDGSVRSSIARVSDSALMPGVRTFGAFYSKKQVWNADDSKVLLWAPWASPRTSVALLNADLSFNRLLIGVSYSHFWLNTHPDLVVTTLPENPVLRVHNVATDDSYVVADFASMGFVEMEFTLGGGEGNPSNDDRYWPIGLKDIQGNWQLVIWDQFDYRITGRIPIPWAPGTGSAIDWHGMSQSGEFYVTASIAPWFNGQIMVPTGINVWSRSGDYLRTYYTAAGGTQNHVDLGVDADGRDVLVYLGAEHGGAANDKFIATWRLDGSDGNQSRRQLDEGYLHGNFHISCRNLKRPGMCVFSTFAGEPGIEPQLATYPLNNRIFAVMLDGSGRIAPIANARHSTIGVDGTSYDMQAHATPNRNLSAVLFRSAWDYFATTAPWVTDAYVAREP